MATRPVHMQSYIKENKQYSEHNLASGLTGTRLLLALATTKASTLRGSTSTSTTATATSTTTAAASTVAAAASTTPTAATEAPTHHLHRHRHHDQLHLGASHLRNHHRSRSSSAQGHSGTAGSSKHSAPVSPVVTTTKVVP
ncbi:unnamed protein product [Closterium sp. NIES-53]